MKATHNKSSSMFTSSQQKGVPLRVRSLTHYIRYVTPSTRDHTLWNMPAKHAYLWDTMNCSILQICCCGVGRWVVADHSGGTGASFLHGRILSATCVLLRPCGSGRGSCARNCGVCREECTCRSSLSATFNTTTDDNLRPWV